MTVKSYRDLEVYQRARKLILPVYQLAEQLPKDERFDLRDQTLALAFPPGQVFAAHANQWWTTSSRDTVTKTPRPKPNHSGASRWARQMKWSSTWNKSSY